jgi:hypothetical protein
MDQEIAKRLRQHEVLRVFEDTSRAIPPEQALWLRVVETFIDDIGNPDHSQKYGENLLQDAATDWGEMIADLAGIEYEVFIERLIERHRIASYARRWNV